MNCLLAACASEIRISGLFDGLSAFQLFDLVSQERPIKSVGMVKVSEFAQMFRHIPLVLIVRVLWDDSHRIGGQTFHDFSHHSGLARPCAAGYSDDEHRRSVKVQLRRTYNLALLLRGIFHREGSICVVCRGKCTTKK